MADLPNRTPAGEFLRFGAIGLLATGIHAGVTIALMEGGLAMPVPANVAAFFLANAFAFLANSHMNFRRRPSRKRYLSFLAISLLGLLLTASVAELAERLHWHYLEGLALILLIAPVLSFLLQRRFTFR